MYPTRLHTKHWYTYALHSMYRHGIDNCFDMFMLDSYSHAQMRQQLIVRSFGAEYLQCDGGGDGNGNLNTSKSLFDCSLGISMSSEVNDVEGVVFCN